MDSFNLSASLRESLSHQRQPSPGLAGPLPTPVRLGGLHADGDEAHALFLSIVEDWLILECFDTDKEEPLRPQMFAFSPADWNQLRHAYGRGLSGENGVLFELGRLRKLRICASAGSVALSTEDRYGPHFDVALDDDFPELMQKATAALQAVPQRSDRERFEKGLAHLADGSWKRFHPVLTALQDQFEPRPDLVDGLAGGLISPNSSLVLFVCSLLHSHLVESDPGLLAWAQGRVVEREPPGPEREAAEGQLAILPSLPPEVIQMLASQVGRVQHDLRAVGSLLRPLHAVGNKAEACVPELAALLPSLQERAGESRRPEYDTVITYALDILGACPSRWRDSRPAVELLRRQGDQRAEAVKQELIPFMPVKWEDGLEADVQELLKRVPRLPPDTEGPPTAAEGRPPGGRIPIPQTEDEEIPGRRPRSEALAGSRAVSSPVGPAAPSPPPGPGEPRPQWEAGTSLPRQPVSSTEEPSASELPEAEESEAAFAGPRPATGEGAKRSRFPVIAVVVLLLLLGAAGAFMLGFPKLGPDTPEAVSTEVATTPEAAETESPLPVETSVEETPAAAKGLFPAGELAVAGFGAKEELYDYVFPKKGFKLVEKGEGWSRHQSQSGNLVVLWSTAGRAVSIQGESLMVDGAEVARLDSPELGPEAEQELEDWDISLDRDADGKVRSFTWRSGDESSYAIAPHVSEPAGSVPILAARNQVSALRQALTGENAGLRLYDGTPFMHTFLSSGDPAEVEVFLAAGADPNLQDWEGRTALHKTSYPKVAARLLDKGADPNKPDQTGRTPLFEQDGEVLALLLERGGDPNKVDQKGRSPLFYADDLEEMKLLLRKGANPALKDSEGKTAAETMSPSARKLLEQAIAENATLTPTPEPTPAGTPGSPVASPSPTPALTPTPSR
ncbi:MAG: hypothetical protein HY319_18705 [Armatimonadetes bacterium]|nr:hypothetical protein [Armatimonadota bacterium]